MTAISESALRGAKTVLWKDLDDWLIRTIEWPLPVVAADFMSRRAEGFGVTRDFGGGSDYSRSRPWAEVLFSISYGGIQYWARHDLGVAAASVAVFGRDGERRRWKRGRAQRLSDDRWVQRIVAETGVRIAVDVASDSELVFVTEPNDE